jgi:lycopene beta-cyclase
VVVESAAGVLESKPTVGPPRSARGAGPSHADYLLVGGGLQNALVALAVLERRPDARLVLVERESQLGGNHTWCFHESDVSEAARRLLEPLVVQRWPAHDVVFPRFRRRLPGAYLAITSQRLHEWVNQRLVLSPNARRVTANVVDVGADAATLSDGQRLTAEVVVDARGPEHTRGAPAGYQKFVGLELALEPGSAPEVPMLMDATVTQLDGFRFMYVLPWSADRVLVEDTYYSSAPELDVEALHARVLEYAAAAGMHVREVLRKEHGVLPIPARLDVAPSASGPLCSSGPLRAGYAGGLFHPTTGYSLPVAARLALFIAEQGGGATLGPAYQRWVEPHRRQAGFCLLLNRLLFGAFAPTDRFRVLERFYRLPVSTIRRFYALDMSALDRARILCGRPPEGFSMRRLLAGGNLA